MSASLISMYSEELEQKTYTWEGDDGDDFCEIHGHRKRREMVKHDVGVDNVQPSH